MTDIAFLHGGGQGGWVWEQTIAALHMQADASREAARGGGRDRGEGAHRPLAFDAPGCGRKRDRDTHAMTMAEVNRELADDIVDADFHDVVLVGHSQAGGHMPAVAALIPDRIARLVSVSCIAIEPGLTVMEMNAEHMPREAQTEGTRAFVDASMPMRERFRLMFCNDMAPADAEAFLDKLGPDMWPRCCYEERDWTYAHLADMPVTYVLCLRDAILPLYWQQKFAERFYADRLVRLDAGHQAMNTRPFALAEIILGELV